MRWVEKEKRVLENDGLRRVFRNYLPEHKMIPRVSLVILIEWVGCLRVQKHVFWSRRHHVWVAQSNVNKNTRKRYFYFVSNVVLRVHNYVLRCFTLYNVVGNDQIRRIFRAVEEKTRRVIATRFRSTRLDI